MNIPLLDLNRQYESIKEDIKKSIDRVLSSQRFILGDDVSSLEENIAEYCGVRFGIGVASGTDALFLSLRASGISRGDYVITTPFTFFATAGAISNIGATPIFVDIKKNTYNIDPTKIRELMEGKSFHHNRLKIKKSRIKAIIPVHLYGQVADMDEISDIANKYNLSVIEDACQAIGAKYKEKKAGSIGNLGCFSFFPTKNLGGYGDGGMIITNKEDLKEIIRKLRVHGSKKGYVHSMIGLNSRLDTLQAAVLLVKLPHLDEWNERRNKNAKHYSENLRDIEFVQTPEVEETKMHIFHQYTIRVKGNKRDELKNFLKEKNIGTKVYYPLPLHLQDCYSDLGYKMGDQSVAESASREVLSLPIFPELTRREIDYICAQIRKFF